MNDKIGPWRITFDTNPDDCNLSCIMCEEHSPYRKCANMTTANHIKRRMDIALIDRILQDSQATALREIIPSTMGEPLLYKHFTKLIELCKKYQLKLNLTTNGTFPGKTVEEWAHLIIPLTSDIKISWNGATKETQEAIMLGSNWERKLQNIKKFIEIRNKHAGVGKNYCRVTLQLTFLESNVHELAAIVKLGVELGVDRIKGHHLWVHCAELESLSMRRNVSSIKRWNHAVLAANKIAETYLLPNEQKIKLENIYILDRSAQYEPSPNSVCPFLGQEAWIATDGQFNPCCAPEYKRSQLGTFGNLYEKSVLDIWTSKEYLQLKENYFTHEICQQCNMRNYKVIDR